jgi:hypothetical protein
MARNGAAALALLWSGALAAACSSSRGLSSSATTPPDAGAGAPADASEAAVDAVEPVDAAPGFAVQTNPIILAEWVQITPGAASKWTIDWWVHVTASGGAKGIIDHVEYSLTDAASGAALGSFSHVPVIYSDKNGTYYPLQGGTQDERYIDDWPLYQGAPALMHVTVFIVQDDGQAVTAETDATVESLPAPVLVAPAGVEVRQNDPTLGCASDPVAGYGFVIDAAWEPVPSPAGAVTYVVAIATGSGEWLTIDFVNTDATSLHYLRCGAYVDDAGRLGAMVWVSAHSAESTTVDPGWMHEAGWSPWGGTAFSFEACEAAGTPACQ